MIKNVELNQIFAVTAIMLPIYLFLYLRFFRNNNRLQPGSLKKDGWSDLAAILMVGFAVRLYLSWKFEGCSVDMNLFKAWGKQMVDSGLSSAYNSDTFIDYPPGYLCVLSMMERLARLIAGDNEAIINLCYKLPSSICDIVLGCYIYKIAGKYISKKVSLMAVFAYLFNPAVLLNSAVWGQVDAVYTLAVVAMIYYITMKKLPVAYFVCIAGVLLKPQMMFFAPILLWAIVEQVFLEDFNWKKFWVNLCSGLISIGCAFLFMIPFGIGDVISQYTDTLGSYPYASVNACNFWGMLGKNWVEQTEKFLGLQMQTWGTLFLIIAVVFSIFLCYRLRKKQYKYFFAAACLMLIIFTMSVRMHERYMFPALALLLIVYCMKPVDRLFLQYIGLSVVQFLNVGFVLVILPDYEGYTGPKMPEFVIISIMTVAMFVSVIYTAVWWCLRKVDTKESECILPELETKDALEDKAEQCSEDKMQQSVEDGAENEGEKISSETTEQTVEPKKEKKKRFFDGITPSKVLGKMTRLDIYILLAIVFAYSAVALYNLGDKEGETPSTEYYSQWYRDGEAVVYPSITLDLGFEPNVSKLAYYLGNYENREFKVETASSLDGPWTDRGTFEMVSVFCWGEYIIATNERYLRLSCNNDTISLMELVVLNTDNNMITPLNSGEYEKLFDENMTYGGRTARNGTYFDEIYHARSAYEFIQDRYCYEWTHPPLGKCFIALGMLIFGVCPFGWRIMGVLFGIAMLPLIYLFIKRMLKETWIAACVTILFAFDFMHFTQTRIATIDVFVTFFIIGMYYFMYKYVSMSFYDTPLKKTWIPLGLSGIFMGLGVASKWTGAYAGVGLAIIFFASIYRRWCEYVYAKKQESGSTNGIEHQHVIDTFKKNTIKTLAFCVVFFVIIPCIIYLLSYIPFNDGTDDNIIIKLLRNQEKMFSYHAELESTHPYSCTWDKWPIMYRPIWYYSRHVTDTVSEGISAFGNPLVWWVGIPAFCYMIHLIWKDRDRKAAFLVVAYLAQYLPWCLVSRTTYMYHYFPSVPFVTIMIGYAIYKLVGKNKKKRIAAYVYVAAVVVLFLLFYPVISGYPVEKQWVFDYLKWFDTWVLVT